MIIRFFVYLIIKVLGDDDMMALLFAERVILGKTDFNIVPESLKPKVYEELKISGAEHLAGDYTPSAS
jgi:hypothetical protein